MNTQYNDKTGDSSNSSYRASMTTGLFNDRESVERAYNSITDRGYDRDDVHLVMSDATRKNHFSTGVGIETELDNKATEGAGIGGAIGGTVGAVAAAIFAVGTTLAIPGLGLVIAGPAAAAIAGLGAGGLTGGVVGALIGLGIPEERVKHYQTGIDEGGILMGVKARSEEDADYFEKEWKANDGIYIYR